MTIALCLNCGETKFGAICPCGRCGSPATGDMNLDILFSDHRMPVKTLEAFGTVVHQLAERCDDPEVRLWAFLEYLSVHPLDLLQATPPPELADRVQKLLAEARLPIVEATLKPDREPAGPPQRVIDVPEPVLRAYGEATKFLFIQRVQVRRRDGAVFKGTLLEVDGAARLMLPEDTPLLPDEIVALRTSPGCLLGWIRPPKWIEA